MAHADVGSRRIGGSSRNAFVHGVELARLTHSCLHERHVLVAVIFVVKPRARNTCTRKSTDVTRRLQETREGTPMNTPRTGLEMQSLVRESGELQLSLEEVRVPEPAHDDVLVRIEAAPINPSDQGLMFAVADMASLRLSGTRARPVVTGTLQPERMKAVAGRVGQSMTVGNEGAGVVVEAGSSAEAQALLGRTVAIFGGGTYAQLRAVKASHCLALP